MFASVTIRKELQKEAPAVSMPGYGSLRRIIYTLQWSWILLKVALGVLTTKQDKTEATDERLFEVALGNRQAKLILKKLYRFQRKNYVLILLHFRKLNIEGCRIVQLYKASKASMKQFSFACNDLYRLVTLLQEAEAHKTEYIANEKRKISHLSKDDHLKKQVLELSDIPGLRKWLTWTLFLKIKYVDSYLEEAIYSFLIADNINCCQWYLNYSAMKDSLLLEKLHSEVSPYILSHPQDKAPFFPMWFIAAYPHVVQWCLQPSSACSLYNFLSVQDEILTWHQLRVLLNEYGDASTLPINFSGLATPAYYKEKTTASAFYIFRTA
ncbi:MAG TPA: hypothetical protein VL093_14700 [Flavipsychrobacter sp.]|nr:hypothetical protein [Flavipsychrobacter sp.]